MCIIQESIDLDVREIRLIGSVVLGKKQASSEERDVRIAVSIRAFIPFIYEGNLNNHHLR